MQKKLKIEAGAIIAVPVKDYYVIGLIAAERKATNVILCYFLFKTYDLNIDLNKINDYKKNEQIIRTGINGFKTSGWKLIGSLPNWNQSDSRIPVFFRHTEPMIPQLIFYNNNLEEIKTLETTIEDKKLYPSDGVYGTLLIPSILQRLFP